MKRGFTLIELLVVIAIIGILASVVMVSLNGAREKSRDAARKSQLAEIAKALDLYYLECGDYRLHEDCVSGVGDYYGASGFGFLNLSYSGAGSIAQGLVDLGLMGAAPIDPLGNTQVQGGRAAYMIRANADNYAVYANLESAPSTDSCNTPAGLSSYDGYTTSLDVDGRINYCVTN